MMFRGKYSNEEWNWEVLNIFKVCGIEQDYC
jgi:hypothetical protein